MWICYAQVQIILSEAWLSDLRVIFGNLHFKLRIAALPVQMLSVVVCLSSWKMLANMLTAWELACNLLLVCVYEKSSALKNGFFPLDEELLKSPILDFSTSVLDLDSFKNIQEWPFLVHCKNGKSKLLILILRMIMS